ncbi:STAS domain-containing protein [Streptomyces sp. NPDC059491]|uniref:STAS domain-containing protein n=1 Tax=Streptomyces sp. NPDC059491 TaxID=3346850 RepID=UPI0036C8B8B8
MTTSSNPPILSTSSSAAGLTQCEEGADAAPCGISVRSFTVCAGDALRIALHGEVDHHSATPLRLLLDAASRNGYRRLVLDTSLVTFADSALLRILRGWTEQGHHLRLTGVTPAMERLRAAAWGPPPTPRRRAAIGKGPAGEEA